MTGGRELVFVYGTLRRGGSNHFRMAGAEFIGSGNLGGRLYRIDWYPGLVLDAAEGPVRGEVFAVVTEQFAALDDFEGPEYRRVRAGVVTESGETLGVWVWEWQGCADESRRIADGDWFSGNAPEARGSGRCPDSR